MTKLVIISGSEAIAKKLIAHQIQAKLNSWTTDEGFSVDISSDPWIIYDADDNVVDADSEWFDGDVYNDEEILAHHAIYNKLKALEENFRTYKYENHYYNKFVSLNYDLVNHVLTGVSDDDKANCVIPWLPENDPDGDNIHYDSEFDDVVSKYNACTDDYQVITGSFGLEFITRIRAALGTENVLVYNITRNPSVAFTLHQRITDFSNDQVDLSESDHALKLYNAVYNSAILKEAGITTVKFEDMITDESLDIDGTDVGIYLDFNAYNDWLTVFENNAIINNVPTTAQQVTDWNTLAAAFTLATIDSDDAPLDTVMGTPWNLFEKLGYDPLTLTAISAS